MKKIIALTLALVMSLSCFSLISFAEETETMTTHLTEVPEGYVGVYAVEDLYFVRNDLTANYILMNDIDLSEATAEGGDWNYGGRGWNPIGSNDIYDGLEFSGIFDGNNYKITGINIDIVSYPSGRKLDTYIGLFSKVSGTIKNLTVDGNITTENTKTYLHGSTNPNYYFGGICAYITSTGKIENCINNVSISIYSPHTASGPSPNLYLFQISNYIGGITGYNEGIIESCANYADLKVITKTDYRAFSYCAGIAGYTSFSSATVSCCTNNGNINAINNGYKYSNHSDCSVYAYGISSGNAQYCYNSGSVTATLEILSEYKVGAASAHSCGISRTKAKSCYNVGMTNGYAVSDDKYYTSNCYYLENTGENSNGATLLTEKQMKLQSMYSGWDFDTIWTMEGRADYPYPELRDVPLILPDDLKTEITGTVTITGEATVGSTLKAEIKDLTPADAEIEYEWKADDVVVGTGDSYTVTQADAGKEITLSIKGAGDFKGNITSSAVVGECVHSLGEYTNNNDATCESNATRFAVCELCSETVTEEIENSKLAHIFENYVSDNNATCITNGTKTAKCENCDETDTVEDEGTKTGHAFAEWTTIIKANCSQDGVAIRTCRNCSLTETDITPAFGHSDKDGDDKCDECSVVVSIPENSGNTEGSGETTIIVEKDNVFTFLRSFLNTLIEFLRSLLKI